MLLWYSFSSASANNSSSLWSMKAREPKPDRFLVNSGAEKSESRAGLSVLVLLLPLSTLSMDTGDCSGDGSEVIGPLPTTCPVHILIPSPLAVGRVFFLAPLL